MTADSDRTPPRQWDAPLGRCACGKALFRNKRHARSHAGNVHSERMRVYRCKDGGIHLTNAEKAAWVPVVSKRVIRAARRRERRTGRRKSRQELSEWG